MVSEAELMELSFPGAPKVSESLPGPETKRLWEQSLKYETPTRAGGSLLQFVWDEAFGTTIKDPDGNIFIDMAAGLGVNNVGHSHPKVVEAIVRQAKKVMHTIDMVNPMRSELARRLGEIMPPGLRGNCFTAFDTSGSGAVETALKYAKMITKRTEMIAFHGAYHGVYGASLALTGHSHYRRGYEPFASNAHHLPYGYCYRCFANLRYPECGTVCGKYVDYVLNTPYTGITNPAAVIVEPIQGQGGYVDPPVEFIRETAAAAKKAGALFIVDEIQAGFGRSGKMWSIEHYGVEPDMLIWGKAVGGDLPLTGVSVRAEYRSKLEVASQPATFPGNALACAAALANIDIMTDPELELMKRAVILGAEIKTALTEAMERSRVMGDVRGRGLMLSVELVKDKETREPVAGDKAAALMRALMSKGILVLMCGRYGNVFRFMPPLTITKEYCYKGINTFLGLVKEWEKELMA